MPFLINPNNLSQERIKTLLIGDPFPNKQDFKFALGMYEDRLAQYNRPVNGVMLLNDVRVLYFSIDTFEVLLKAGASHLVVRYGCEDAIQGYSNLTFILCAMDKANSTIKSEHYIGNNTTMGKNNTHEYLGTLTSWKAKEANYTARLNMLYSWFPLEFGRDLSTFPHGLAHEIAEFSHEWYDDAKSKGIQNVAAYCVKVNGHLSVAFADARIDTRILVNDYIAYDFGSGCCPPQ